ncbi:hypothetical protein COW53_08310 [bacterium CG17_big_fil_post_rev_8_21_14_2_50_64_8]|nr:MAG: hypothetical protein COW53_08310 [bacterium CG17_big_fil_post_rev_8_21_14_2_50_64_8]
MTDSKRTVMKIAIIGTSNAIMRDGWVAHLRERLPEGWTLDNLSIGGSASLHGSFTATRSSVAENYDLALIDFAINDQQMIDILDMSPEYVAGSFSALLRCFAAPGGRCAPIVLIIPQRDLLGRHRQDQAYNITVKLCERYGVAYIDLYHELRRMAAADGVDVAGCFSDWTHLRSFAQQALAAAAHEAVISDRAARPNRLVLDEAPHCRAVADADIEVAPETRETIATSLTSAEVRRIGAGARGLIRNAPWLCGVVHWIDPNSGALCFDGADAKVKKALRKEWTRLFGLTLFKTPLRADPEGVAFRFGDFEDYPLERSYGMTPTTAVDGDRADIVGFLACDRDPVAAGARLLASVAGAADPSSTSAHRVDTDFSRLLLAGWVNDLSSRRGPQPAVKTAAPPTPVAEPADAGDDAPVAVVSHLKPQTHTIAVSIPHGCTTSVRLPITAGVMIVSSEVSMLRCIIGFRAGTRPQLHNLGTPTPNLTLVAGPLDKRSPQEKYTTFGISADGRLEIENLRGGTVSMTLFLIG